MAREKYKSAPRVLTTRVDRAERLEKISRLRALTDAESIELERHYQAIRVSTYHLPDQLETAKARVKRLEGLIHNPIISRFIEQRQARA